ncbi:hypothetical protein ORJ04_21900 [Rheinheimera baltica]|uniref:Lipoprotein n=1 Tax=Rheinheimera baltica TaxID=67576 RepID=A0ABT9I5E7_9GAMM|nr:hypothetical protein [Rheinheimera baltica]MDP5138605.1 hypothetical protein [Rheinheimera baltica]MDP5152067.1 hypothetical protein [Rheinheimera baltica]
MKLLIGLGLLLATFLTHAIGVSCGDEKVTYRLEDKARFDICPNGDGSLSIFANSIGGNYHTCSFEAVAKKIGEQYVAIDGTCKISFVLSNNELIPTFGENCRAYCGMRAS